MRQQRAQKHTQKKTERREKQIDDVIDNNAALIAKFTGETVCIGNRQ